CSCPCFFPPLCVPASRPDSHARRVPGQCPPPCLSSHLTARLAGGGGSHGHATRSPATLKVQRVCWAKLAPSCLVWLATPPRTRPKSTTRPPNPPSPRPPIRTRP